MRAFLLVVVVASVDLLVHGIHDGSEHLVRVRVRGRARVHGVEHLVRVGVRGRVRVHASAGGPTGACDMCTCMHMHMHLDACVHVCGRVLACRHTGGILCFASMSRCLRSRRMLSSTW